MDEVVAEVLEARVPHASEIFSVEMGREPDQADFYPPPEVLLRRNLPRDAQPDIFARLTRLR